jgi:hypothetical protein
MGLFSRKKKQKVKGNTEAPIATDLSIPKLPTNLPEIPAFEEKPISDNDLKEAIKVDLPPKTEFNAKQVNEDIKYLDEILNNDLDLNSKEIDDALENKPIVEKPKVEQKQKEEKEINFQAEIHPEIKKKLSQHNEVIHIDVENEELKPIKEIQPVFSRENPTKPREKQETLKEIKDVNGLPHFDNHSKELEEKTKIIIERSKQRKDVTGDLFVKSSSYKEVLHTNLALKEDAKVSTEKIENIKRTIKTQSKKKEELKANLEFIQDNLMIIEEKLFNKNPYLR